MNPLDCLDDALIALAVCLYDHGPACVCAPCTALAAAQALLLRLGDVLAILEAWSRGEAEEPILPEDLHYLVTVVLEHDHPADRQPLDDAPGQAGTPHRPGTAGAAAGRLIHCRSAWGWATTPSPQGTTIAQRSAHAHKLLKSPVSVHGWKKTCGAARLGLAR